MKRSTLAAISGTTVGLAGVAAAAIAAMRAERHAHEFVHLKADELSYTPIITGASRAVLRGDPDRGAFACFTRFEPGFRVPRHIHSHDGTLVVIRGAYIYQPDGGREVRVGPGEYILIPAGVPHATRGDPIEGALFYQEGSGAFDLKVLD